MPHSRLLSEGVFELSLGLLNRIQAPRSVGVWAHQHPPDVPSLLGSTGGYDGLEGTGVLESAQLSNAH